MNSTRLLQLACLNVAILCLNGCANMGMGTTIQIVGPASEDGSLVVQGKMQVVEVEFHDGKVVPTALAGHVEFHDTERNIKGQFDRVEGRVAGNGQLNYSALCRIGKLGDMPAGRYPEAAWITGQEGTEGRAWVTLITGESSYDYWIDLSMPNIWIKNTGRGRTK